MSQPKMSARSLVVFSAILAFLIIAATTAAAGASGHRFAFIDQVSEFLGMQSAQTSAIVPQTEEPNAAPTPEPLAPEAALTWANTTNNFNAAASWGGTAPGSNDVGLFASAPTTQPTLTANLTIAGIRLSPGSSGYDLTNTGGSVLTLNGVHTSGSGGTTTASATAFRNDT